MDIKITGRKMTVTDSLKDYVNSKIGSAVKAFDISPMKADVVLHVEKNPANPNPAVCEITLIAKRHIIRTEEAGEDMYAAIDAAGSHGVNRPDRRGYRARRRRCKGEGNRAATSH